MEAISMKLPVIATDVGGTREIVENNVNGYLLSMECTAKDVVNCLTKIRDMDKINYSKMSQFALDIWNERCNANVLYSEFAEELKSYK
jgi:glycosyltransferase involved in cell wall biosynthesis